VFMLDTLSQMTTYCARYRLTVIHVVWLSVLNVTKD